MVSLSLSLLIYTISLPGMYADRMKTLFSRYTQIMEVIFRSNVSDVENDGPICSLLTKDVRNIFRGIYWDSVYLIAVGRWEDIFCILFYTRLHSRSTYLNSLTLLIVQCRVVLNCCRCCAFMAVYYMAGGTTGAISGNDQGWGSSHWSCIHPPTLRHFAAQGHHAAQPTLIVYLSVYFTTLHRSWLPLTVSFAVSLRDFTGDIHRRLFFSQFTTPSLFILCLLVQMFSFPVGGTRWPVNTSYEGHNWTNKVVLLFWGCQWCLEQLQLYKTDSFLYQSS